MHNSRVTVSKIRDGWRIEIRRTRSWLTAAFLLGIAIGWVGVLVTIKEAWAARGGSTQPFANVPLLVAAALWTIVCGLICAGLVWGLAATEAISFTNIEVKIEDYVWRFRRLRSFANNDVRKLRVEECEVTRRGHMHKSRHIAFESPTGSVRLRGHLSASDLEVIMRSPIGQRFEPPDPAKHLDPR
ncbi:MAG: hypothetical protein ACRENS_06720 [Candidatus Eiseniibacteriota bacterium]